MRLKHLQKLAKINILKRQKYSENRIFYSSFIIEKLVAFLYRHPFKNRTALLNLASGRISYSLNILQKKHHFLYVLLLGHLNANNAFSIMKKEQKLWINSIQYLPFFAIMAYKCFDLNTFAKIIKKNKVKKLKKIIKHYYDYIISYAYMQEGDMLSASQSASRALKFFTKKKYIYETISCYLLLGDIYKSCCVNDIADSMFTAGLNLASNYNFQHFETQFLGNLGMLRVLENRIAEARDKYETAIKKAPSKNLKAEIFTQTALLEISEDNIETSYKHAKQSLEIFSQNCNNIGKAYTLQIMGHIYFKKNNFIKASKFFEQASLLYLQQKNYSAYMECLYTISLAFNNLHKNRKAEKFLRIIIDTDSKHKNNFHVANAYNLLGLIFLEKRDLQRAKVLFQQSLLLEQSNNRYQGIVADYADLALIENIMGNKYTAKEHLSAALEFAENSKDATLIAIIKKKIDALS